MPLTPDLLADLRTELERQLARLERSMAISDEARKPVQLDQQSVGRLSRMDAMQNQQMSRNLHEREEARYGAVRAALARMEDGSYGECTECGGEIDPGRLFVVPEAEHCTGCSA